MLTHEVCKMTNLTKKAIEYYIGQGLLSPALSDNGYRDFNAENVACLNKISVLRKLGLGTEEIRTVLNDGTNTALQKLSVKKELHIQKEEKKKRIMEKLQKDMDYSKVKDDLEALDQNAAIAERLLDSFPGYYGRLICLHFARFLNEPAITEDQKEAYAEILSFLDDLPDIHFPKDVEEYLDETVNGISTKQIGELIDNTKKSIEDPDKFLSENKEILEYYYKYMQSDEYKNSAAWKLKNILNEFNHSSGYYDVFLPAMKRLSPAYAKYCRQSELANEKILEKYPVSGE